MSIFLGSNAGETITPDTVSPSVGVIGNPKKPSASADIIFAGGGNDTVAGGAGTDLAFLGTGDDTFIWNAGDGNDVVVGDSGFDTLKFNGANLNEDIEISSLLGAVAVKGSVEIQGQKLSSTLALTSMERIDVATFDGEDKVTIKNLSNTALKEVAVDLGGTANGTTGDGAVDQIVAHGANTRDVVEVSAQGSTVTVEGLSVDLTIKNADANDRLTIKGNGGNDLINAANVAAGSMLFTFDGGAGNDSMHGSNGNDIFIGGEGNDFVDGNRGDDTAFLGLGNDTFVWDPGDGSDIVEGGEGRDLMLFNGAGVAENVDIAANGERVRFFRDVANITMDLNDVEKVTFNALGGADNVVVHDLSGTDVNEVNVSLASPVSPITGDGAADRVTVEGTVNADSIAVASANGTISVSGLAAKVNVSGAEATNDTLVVAAGAGNDTIDASKLAADQIQLEILGGDGNDKITGSAGSDLIVGGRGDDAASMGAGDDTFVWNPGEGSDTVEGGEGFSDAMDFVGNAANENVDITANGERVRFFRDVANVTMDLNDVERILFSSLGGTDNIHVGDLKGTDIENVTIEMSTTRDSLTGDGAKDVVTVDGSADDDSIDVEFANGVADVNLFHNFVNLLGIESGDQIIVNAGAGDDLIGALNVQTGAPSLVLDGGTGDDVILGSDNADTLIGGEGNDIIDGEGGNDVALMGAGDDRFIWDPGEGSDVVEGGEGFDTMEFNGNGAAENITISANGERTTFFRNLGNITMDINDVDRVLFNALGGEDNVVVKHLDGFDVLHVDIDLAGEQFGTTGDGAIDTVTTEGTADGDVMSVDGELSMMSVYTGGAYLGVTNAEATDRLILQGLGGDDMMDASRLAGGIDLTLDGGAGDDFILGSNGVETIIGGDGNDFADGNGGNDVALLGAGDDEFVWDPGDGSDTVEGGEGFDTMTFNGAGANEPVQISADGERVRFFRQPGNITMDLNDVERVTFNALGGTDDVTVRDLTGTDVQEVEIDLAGVLFGTTGDGQVDQVTVDGSLGDDFIDVLGFNGSLAVIGTSAFTTIKNSDSTDRLVLSGGLGNDSISATTSLAQSISFTFDGGSGDDTLFGSSNADLLIGGAGDDFVTGNRGDDVADLGGGDDIFIWNPGDGSDTIDGGKGVDFMGFRGANVAENIDISADGDHVKFVRDVANVTMDLVGVERMTFNAFGGVDTINVGDMSGTEMQDIEISLLNSGLPNDGAEDSVTIAGSAGADAIDISTANKQTSIDGLSAHVSISGADAGLDRLTINAGAGDDAINASGLGANLFQLSIAAGEGNDAIIGSNGDDTLDAGSGDDIVSGEDGDDVIDGGEGLDILLGGAGDDIFLNGELIQDFTAGAGSDDRIDLRGLAVSFDWIMDHATDVEGSTLLDFGDTRMLLADVTTASLHQDDFLV
jgi:Ca2+-binding RTX toxin-like protein